MTLGKTEILGKEEKSWQRLVTLDQTYESVCKSFRTGRLERELQIVQLSATRGSCIAIL